MLPDEDEVIIIGSQAVQAWIEDLPDEVSRSREVDVVPVDDADDSKAMRVNWVMGELSPFDDEHDVYAEGVGLALFAGPTGWMQRARALVVGRSDGTELRVLCPEPHDLCVSKLVAGREKDIDFVTALARLGVVDLDRISHVLTGTDVDRVRLRRAADLLHRIGRTLPERPTGS